MSKLILLTTPIGNLEDITLRAKNVLETFSNFAVEDTRSFRELCKKLGVSLQDKSITSLHDHSEEQKLQNLIDEVSQGKELVVVSEAGSPAISDPAYPLIKLAVENNIKVSSAPGVSSVITALELSALPAIPFHFHGFLPREKGKKEKLFQSHGAVYGTHIYFEGVSRVKKTMAELTNLYPMASFAIARELTKDYESVYRFNGSEWQTISEDLIEKGEFVIMWHNENQDNIQDSQVIQMAAEILENGVHPKKISKLLSKLTGKSPKDCYELIQKSKS